MPRGGGQRVFGPPCPSPPPGDAGRQASHVTESLKIGLAIAAVVPVLIFLASWVMAMSSLGTGDAGTIWPSGIEFNRQHIITIHYTQWVTVPTGRNGKFREWGLVPFGIYAKRA